MAKFKGEWIHEIEDYKGQTIYYDENLDKFICDMASNDQAKNTKRGSLKDVRREIDLFIKANIGFKPFKFIQAGGWDGIKVYEATALRTDKTLNVESQGGRGYGGHWGKKDFNKSDDLVYQFDQGVVDSIKKLQDEKAYAEKAFDAKQKAIIKTLKKLDVSRFDLE